MTKPNDISPNRTAPRGDTLAAPCGAILSGRMTDKERAVKATLKLVKRYFRPKSSNPDTQAKMYREFVSLLPDAILQDLDRIKETPYMNNLLSLKEIREIMKYER